VAREKGFTSRETRGVRETDGEIVRFILMSLRNLQSVKFSVKVAVL
jgi:hypothetical protein